MKILLIDDDIFFRKFYTAKLTENGFSVEEAANGHEGIDKLNKGDINLVLLDIVMPQMDGFEVLKIRANNPALSKIPVIVLTTLGQEQDIENIKKLGANEYINKTFYNFEELLVKIKALVK
jgi:two-component system, OmpR family, response regulator CpxR